MASRKRIYYMDLAFVENGEYLNPFQQIVRNRLGTAHDWDAAIFWLDLESALESATEHQRTCFSLKYVEGYTEKEIAKILKITQPTVSRHISRGIKNIKNFLSDGYKNP